VERPPRGPRERVIHEQVIEQVRLHVIEKVIR